MNKVTFYLRVKVSGPTIVRPILVALLEDGVARIPMLLPWDEVAIARGLHPVEVGEAIVVCGFATYIDLNKTSNFTPKGRV